MDMETNSLTDTLSAQIYSDFLKCGISDQFLKGLPLVERPADPAHGDFATTVSLAVFGKIKKENPQLLDELQVRNPRELATRVAAVLTEHTDIFASVSVAGPGFINMTLSNAWVVSQLSVLLTPGQNCTKQVLAGKKVMTEFTDPNPFKELHIGHLYSNIIGEAISRILEAQGAVVQRVCYQGDVGMHVAKSVWGMRTLLSEVYPNTSLDEALKKLEDKSLSERVNFLGKSYARGATAYKNDDAVATQIKDINYMTFLSGQENLVEKTNWQPQVDYKQYVTQTAQNYDEIKKLYNSGRSWSLAYFDRMYQRIGMKFDDFFYESTVGEYGIKIVREHLASGVFEESQGAVIFPGEKYGLHNRVFINSLGLPTYEAKELGLAPEKYRRFAYDRSIIITGNEIDEYFKVLLKALEITNPDLRAKTVHMSHGMVRLPEGKMSSRTGKIITAEWLVNEARARIETVLTETRDSLSPQERAEISEVVGLSAIKFAFLKQSVGKDIAFNFEESLSFSGNSGPYLLYTLVRAQSVLRTAKEVGFSSKNRDITNHIDIVQDLLMQSKDLLQKNERDILLNSLMYSDVVSVAAREYAPHHIAGALFELAQRFNAFYAGTKIVDTQNAQITDMRILITQVVEKIISHGLATLGIKTVTRM